MPRVEQVQSVPGERQHRDGAREVENTSEQSHTPSKGVQRVGRRAGRWIEDGKAGRNFTQVERDRAHQLAEGRSLFDAEVKKMRVYFKGHQVDKEATGFRYRTEGFPSPGRVAWGRDEGKRRSPGSTCSDHARWG